MVAIEQIKAGDRVISTNPRTFETAEKSVLETYVRQTNKLIHLVIDGEEIVTTETHPFYVKDCGFVGAGKLQAGEHLLNANGKELLIEEFWSECLDEPETVYNFQVEDFHTYHVGEQFVLVHNASSKYATAQEFEKAISHMSPDERVAAVRNEAAEVARNAGLIKDRKLSKITGRTVYRNQEGNQLYSVDTQHGRFEVLNKRGRHLGEVDFDFKLTKSADIAGQHDLK